jgi:phenylpropionate dioxygenase-like ring-hydroxylating dioxygenase large terminal subunit
VNSDHERLHRHWLVGCEARRLRKRPLGVDVLGVPLVLYRSGPEIIAAEDRCPHRNAPLSHGRIERGRLRCPYHGWCFDGEGRCVEAPGAAGAGVPQVGLRRYRARELDGWIWVAPWSVPAEQPLYRPVAAHDPAYRGFLLSAELEADLPDALENLLDGTHTPFVHSGLVRTAAAPQSFRATVRRTERYVEAEYRGERRQHGIISHWFEPPREVSFGRYVPPMTAELEYRSARRTELLVTAHFTPTTPGRLRVFVKCYLPAGKLPAAVRFAVVRPFFLRVLEQDRRILRLQQANVSRFGGRSYTQATTDLLRPWIDAWLADGRFPEQPDGPREVDFYL